MSNLSVNIGRLKLKNPVMVASGTFGYAEEFNPFLDLKKLAAIITKTITLKPLPGNPPARTCETPAGMLNSIGLENPGLEVFIKDKLPFLKKIGVPIIVSIASRGGQEEFVELAKHLDKVDAVCALELNISCPNIKNLEPRTENLEPKLIAQDAKATYDLVKAVRKVTKKTIITKLSPNVTSITDIAMAAEAAGTSAISLINTLIGMSIDVETHRPKIASITGGLSGPAIRPIAVRMVWEVARKTKVPVIGIGGIMNATDALEFIIAGATCIQIGTANFIEPSATVQILNGIKMYMKKNNITDINRLVGTLEV